MAPRDVEQLGEAILQRGDFCALLPPWPGVAAVAASLLEISGNHVLLITDGPVTMDRTALDLEALLEPGADNTLIATYPPRETKSGQALPETTGERLGVLRGLHDNNLPVIIVTCIQALLQKTASPDWIKRHNITITKGIPVDTETLLPWIEESGYSFEAEVLSPGQASGRGGIIDIWPPGRDWPVRIELFGDTVESIRTFNPADQRSREQLETFGIFPACEKESQNARHLLADHLPENTAWVWADSESIATHADLYEHAMKEADATSDFTPIASIKRDVDKKGRTLHVHLTLEQRPGKTPWELQMESVTGMPTPGHSGAMLDHIEELRGQFLLSLLEKARHGWSVEFFFSTQGGMERFMESHGRHIKTSDRVLFHHGVLSESLSIPPIQRLLISDADFYGLHRDQTTPAPGKNRARRVAEVTGERIHAWTDIQPGDYVVHVEHGIGIYRGMHDIEVNGRLQETLTIEYADGARLYVPVAQTHLLSRYIGVGKRHPELHAIGGKRWLKEKIAAEKAVEDLAAALLETQAARDSKPGHAFAPDNAWQHEFESSFPFQETPDQALAIQEVKSDMEKTRPMDRLICGDVGYGKTEVAMRAAFKAVMDGKQVAILVPTTVLAQQHLDSFSERMSAFPVRIASLSRFQTKSEQLEVLQRLASGEVDIVIGTHRLVQKDVHFRDLGLVIIDEEQRFGVKHKEFLKRLRQLVDVLTMTATPIPRTLYMSLTGAKDLSIIETAPVERLPIETIVGENRDDIIREAILRELNREGQVYYLHNRVQTIERMHLRLCNLVPEARIRVAHGQMNEHQLSDVMRAFTRGEFDVLLCTTIIESGLNIPNVNTIIIERADRFGLSELYQLRGRVGRYKRKAYAYLLLPKHGKLFFMARQRIGAIKRYSSLGSGFKLAMRDLELRGAGNILGSEQSGHIATVGFDLYCQLLRRTVSRLKGEATGPVVDVDLMLDFISLSTDASDAGNAAAIPISYIEDETIRVRTYRRIAAMNRTEEPKAMRVEMKDRFGPLPEPMQRLLLLAELRIVATGLNIRKIEVSGEKVIMTRAGDYIMPDKKFPRLPPGGTTERLEKLLNIVRKSVSDAMKTR